MFTGTWTAAYLFLAAAAPAVGVPPDVNPMKSNKFEIPINIAAGQRDHIARLELHCSHNGGKTWEQVGTATPDQSAFPFTAPTDGTYWFTVLIVDRKGKVEPRSPYNTPPGLKVLVDTEPPDFRILSAERQGDVINVRWEAREEYPNLGSFRLEYKPAEGSSDWTTIPSTQSLMGQAVLRHAGAVSVRATLADVAGNVGVAREVKVGGAGVVTVAAQTTEPAGNTGSPQSVGGAAAVASQPPIAPAPLQKGTGTAATEIKSLPAKELSPSPVAPSSGDNHVSPTLSSPLAPPPSGGDGRTDGSADVLAASSEPKRESATPAASPATADRDMTAQPVNNPQVSMEFEVAKFGPSGVGSVDLYMTRDDGQTWQKVAAKLGPTVSARPGEPMRRTVSVQLGEDGAYGFTLVVHSRAGLGKPAPRPAEAPQMRLELDTKAPEAELFKPVPSPAQQDTLVLQWKAKDKNLGSRPVSLEWAEQPRGEWKTIGDKQLPNTGSYTWKVPTGIPPEVYLRLTVRDSAGNVAVAETRQPVPIDLIQPEAHFTGKVLTGGQ